MAKCDQCIVRELSSLSVLNKDEVLRLVDCKITKDVKKGEQIFHEGESINGVYCIKNGICKLTKLSANGKDQIVKLGKRGDLLGQRSMISDEPSNLGAVALEDMEVCFIPRGEVVNFFNNNNKFSMNIMRTICDDLKISDDHMVSMAQKSVKERLAETLLKLHNNFGVDNNGFLQIQLTREELAGMIGTATESCIRLLSEFKKKNIISLSGKKITLLNIAELKRLAE